MDLFEHSGDLTEDAYASVKQSDNSKGSVYEAITSHPPHGFDCHTFIAGYGWLPDAALLPGEGGMIQNYSGQEFTITFIGEVLQGYLTLPVPSGFSVRSSMVPQRGGITTLLGFGPEDGLAAGDKLHRFVNLTGSYVIYTYDGVAWYRTTPTPAILLEPLPEVGESFWIEAVGSKNWQRSFWVWP